MVMDKSRDYIQQLSDYIKRNLGRGYTLDALRFSLLSQGYSRLSIENAINLANEQLAKEAPPMKEKPQITYKVITDENTYAYEKKHGFFKRLISIFKKS